MKSPISTDGRADGGEFYYCANNKILFSGLQRNTPEGVNFVAEELNVNKSVTKGEGYHLDTFFTPALNKNGHIAALIICEKILKPKSKNNLFNYADNKNIPIFNIPESDVSLEQKEKLENSPQKPYHYPESFSGLTIFQIHLLMNN